MSFLEGLHHRFRRNRLLLFLVLAIVSGGLFLLASRVKLEEDISRFLPKTKELEKINTAMQEMKIRDKTVLNFYLASPDETNEVLLTEMADAAVSELTGSPDSALFSEIRYRQSEESISTLYDLYLDHLPVFVEDAQYEGIERRLNRDSIRALLTMHYRNLISPLGMVSGKYAGRDPLNLAPPALKKLQQLQLDDQIEIYDGYFFSRDHKNLLMFVLPAFHSSDGKKSSALVTRLDSVRDAIWKQSDQKVVMEYYGGPAVSVSNAKVIQKDTRWLTIISLVLILLLLLYYFRNIRAVLVLMLPVVFGALFSLAMVCLLRGSISVIALGAGCVVFGIAVNYSLHILTHFNHYRSVEAVVRDLLRPMFMGCLTTVAAFFSLWFVKSDALHDFGLFAGFALIGTFLFSFLFLPAFLGKPATSAHGHQNLLDRLAGWQPHRNKWILITVILLAGFLSLFSGKVRFEQDMRKLSYESPELTQWHQHLDSINHFTQQSVFISVTAPSREEAIRKNREVYGTLSTFKPDFPTLQYSSLSGIILSDSEQVSRIRAWKQFWNPERVSLLEQLIHQEAAVLGFAPDAFNDFINSLKQEPALLHGESLASFESLTSAGMLNNDDGNTTIYSIVKTPPEARSKLYGLWKDDPMVTVFDNAAITGMFSAAVADDFQTILLTTALMVFGFMLLSRGRIETTLINFLPMLVSWLCILGFMALAGIEFNLINIIVSTFIFGLGDDYSIFILDGMESEYTSGRELLGSYKSAILLSALTTMAGIGTLLFAEHPALKSIAAIGVLGILVVILVSFTLQPMLYNWLILKRAKRGLPPYTALNLLITFVGFLIFLAGSITLTLAGYIIFYLIPAPKKRKKYWFHVLLMYLNRMILAFFINVRKNILYTEDVPVSKQAIMIANHQSHIDLALIMQLHPKIIIFTNDWVYNSPFYGKIVKMAGFYPASRGYETAITELDPLIQDGYSIMIFPEGTRSVDGSIHRFHKGAFFLQEKTGLDILPVLIHGAGDCVTKGDFHFKQGQLTLKILPRITANDTRPGTSYQERGKWINRYMREEYGLMKRELETGAYFRSRLLANYLFKGPVVEWYARIKTRMEDHYALFDSLLPRKGVITDAGCGYGFMAYTLSFTGPERQIKAIDYDADKIALARNSYSAKASKIEFSHGDITQCPLEPSDGIAVMDVLHYLSPDDQVLTLNRLMDHLKPGGILIIRDAEVGMKRKHLFTRYTEFFSTRTGFNKTAGDGLHFLSSGLIEKTVRDRGGFHCEIIDKTRYLSNLIYVIRHN